MPLVDHHDMVKAFPSNRANHALRIGVLPRRPWRDDRLPSNILAWLEKSVPHSPDPGHGSNIAAAPSARKRSGSASSAGSTREQVAFPCGLCGGIFLRSAM